MYRIKLPDSTATLLLSIALLLSPATMAMADYNAGTKAYMKGNYKKALKLFRASAKEGDDRAQFHLGNMYDSGTGVSKSRSKALQWYTKSAKQGNPNAQYNLGILYYTGEGVQQNHNKAVSWWKKAAEQKMASAQFNLAIAYAKGEGVKQNYVKSYMWATLASTHGSKQSRMFMNDMVMAMSLKQLNDADRLANRWLDSHP